MQTKTCNTCNIVKEQTEFYGTRNACKTCVKARSLIWNQANQKLINERHRVRNTREDVKEKRKTYYALNKDRLSAQRAAMPAEIKHIRHRVQKLKKYGIDLTIYDEMLLKQKGACKICGSTNSQRKNDRYLYVDHDHATGRVRGLLCHHCNAGIGHFKDNTELLTKAIAYINE